MKGSKLHRILLLASFFNVLLVAFRNHWWGPGLGTALQIAVETNRFGLNFIFLIWNLFLAWIPFWISLILLRDVHRPNRQWVWPLLLGLWLSFLPNAPYIITDLIHIRSRPPVPMWYDALTIFSFAWTGLLLGMFSLFNVQKWIEQKTGKNLDNWTAIIVLPLCSIGIFFGRFLRWNSWDLFTRPTTLLGDLFEILQHPMQHLNTWSIIFPLTGILFFTYIFLKLKEA